MSSSSRHRRKKKVRLKLILGASAIVVIAVLFVVLANNLTNRTPPPESQKVQAYYDEHKDLPTAALSAKPTVVAFLGDSYAAGVGANPGGGYADTLARTMKWSSKMFAQGGTGYTNPGQTEQNESAFTERVADVVAADPDVVIVQGGINDGSPEMTSAAAEKVFAALRTGLPDAKIIAVGPLATPDFPAAKMSPIRDSLAGAAEAHGVTFIDSMGWLPEANMFADGVHPNQQGHAQIAQHLAEDLGKAGIKPAV